MANKALLVGVNNYRMPGADLQGCVNDVTNTGIFFSNTSVSRSKRYGSWWMRGPPGRGFFRVSNGW